MVVAKKVACAATVNTSAKPGDVRLAGPMRHRLHLSGKISSVSSPSPLDYGANTLQIHETFDACLSDPRDAWNPRHGIYLITREPFHA